MTFTRLKFGLSTRTALLILLLAAQGVASAHEIGHLSSSDSTFCATCSIGHSLGTAVAVCHDAPVVIDHSGLSLIKPQQRVSNSRFSVQFPRAPPLSR